MSTKTPQERPVAGDIFHVELRSADSERTRKFMAEVFGWEFTSTPHPEYHLLTTPGGGEGHLGPVPEEGERPSVTSYLLVDDLDATAEAITANGGHVVHEREEAPGQGSYLWFETPGGETLVAWENASSGG